VGSLSLWRVLEFFGSAEGANHSEIKPFGGAYIAIDCRCEALLSKRQALKLMEDLISMLTKHLKQGEHRTYPI
jgi:hypothetical protein